MRVTDMLGLGLAALLASGCTTGGGTGPVAATPAAAEEIRYATAPCFGACPVYVVTIRPDGSGTFEGQRFTAITGTQAFEAGADGYRRFAAALAPHRPTGERLVRPGTPGCNNAPTDMPAIDVRWSGAAPAHLSFYNGCRLGNETLAEALRSAPEALPIAAMIGDRAAFIGQR